MQAIATQRDFTLRSSSRGCEPVSYAGLQGDRPEVLRILVSIGGVEIDHFGLWHDKAGNAVAQPWPVSLIQKLV